MATEPKVETRKRPINRLQTVYALRALRDEQYEETRQAAKEGRQVAWCMTEGYASPFLNAMGIQSVYTENYATQCAAAGVAQTYLDRAEAEGYPSTLCAYALNTFGYTARMMQDTDGEIPPEAPMGGMPKPDLLIGSAGATCDARYKWYQALGRYLDAPLWIMQTPGAGQREALLPDAHERDVQFVIQGLREFVAFLEQFTGRKFDYDKLNQDIDSTNEMNEAWYQVTDELRRARPCPMNARDHYTAMNASLFRTTNPQGVKDLYRNMVEEIQHRIDSGIAGINYPEKYRVAFHGLGPWHSMSIFDNLAERGWNFVREDYHPHAPMDVSGIKDPIEKLVRFRRRGLEWTLNNNFEPDEITEIKREIMENGFSDKIDGNVMESRNYQLDGVIIHTAITCRMTSCRTGLQQHRLMNVGNVPSMLIMGDMIDARLFDMNDFMKKAEAFEETMDHYKEERKEIGLPW